jgi:2-polyprenyl-6-methoxyphenol hydroxylase-like FAD-dependent oxidoreductase
MATGNFGHAVIIGGSMAGLLSARVLSDHFERVTVLERDEPEGSQPRKGAPQGRHIHVLLEAGLKTLESLFPGFTEELRAHGAEHIDMARDTAWYHCGTWKPRFESDFQSVLATRPHIEAAVRRRVSARPNVVLRHGVSVDSLVTDTERSRVTGVRLKGASGDETLEAALVVDASGRGTRTPRWLESLGYGQVEEEAVDIDLAYTTRLYEPPANPPGDWKLLAAYPRAPGGVRAGFISRVEGGRWIVSLNGYFGDHPPTDDAGFLDFARSLQGADFGAALKHAVPLTPAVTHKIPSSRWFHYERLRRWPEGLLAVGDAVCALNPIYGQGITVASLSMRLLTECLAAQARTSPGRVDGLAPRFQRRLPEAIALSWLLSTTMDLKYPQATGKRPYGLGLLHWGFTTLIDQTSKDLAACRTFYEVLHMRRGMEALLKPGLLGGFLAYAVKSVFMPLARRANVDTLPSAPPRAA